MTKFPTVTLLHELKKFGKQIIQFPIICVLYPYSIYYITETWLSNSVFDREILPCEYTLYRKDRGSRGVLIAVSDSVPSVLISSPEELEIITVNLNYLNGPITLCTVYVPPNSGNDHHKNLLSYLAHVSSSADSVILVADFNLPDVCWSSLIGQSPFSNSFCVFVYEHNFSQLVDCHTHVKGNILDLVLTILKASYLIYWSLNHMH